MRYLIRHETRLGFPEPVREHHCELRLAPRSSEHQRAGPCRITVEPEARLRSHVDCYGNLVHRFHVLAPHDELVTRLEADVETLLANPFDFVPVPPDREDAWLAEALRAHPPLWDFVLHRSAFTPALTDLPDPVSRCPSREAGRSLVDAVNTVIAWIATVLRYESGTTTVDTPLADALAARAGVCQDFAHLLVAVVRSWNVPARYVVGYVDPGYVEDAERPQATHAWAEVLVPGAGWRGFDPVHALVADDTYVAVAVGRDYRDAAPQRGTFKGASPGAAPEVRLQVQRQQ